MTRLSGSSLDRANECPASHALPSIVEPPGDGADRGSAGHLYLENGTVTHGYEEYCADIDVDAARPEADGGDEREISFAFDPVSRRVRCLGTGLNRNYSGCPKGWIPITIDRAFQLNGKTWVVDYKTGRDIPSVDTLQLALGAVCIANYLGETNISVAIIHIEDGVQWYTREYDAIDLADAARKVSSVAERVSQAKAVVASGSIPDVRTGAHCMYCQAKAYCPSTTALARHVLSDGEAILAAVDTMTPEQVGDAWERLQRAEAFVDALSKALKRRIEMDGSAPLPDGRTVKPVYSYRRSVDIDKALEVLKCMGAEAVVKRSLSVGAINEAAKASGLAPKVVWEALEDANAVASVEAVSFRSR